MPLDNTSLSSLLKENHVQVHDRWYPTSVESYKNSFKLDDNVENTRALRSNLAYSMQYLQFLEKELAEMDLSSVLMVMVYKTYVITGMSVLEGLFTNIIKSRGWWKTANLKSLGTTQANETNFDGTKYVIKTEVLKKVPEYSLMMNLDDLIKILERHHSALQVNHLIYPALKRLKSLRNRIHLQKTESDTDHDYNAFDLSVKKEMGSILYEILTSPMVTNSPENFEFLKANSD